MVIAIVVAALCVPIFPFFYVRSTLRAFAQLQRDNARIREARARGELAGWEMDMGELPNSRRGIILYCGSVGLLIGACLGLIAWIITALCVGALH